MSLLSFKQLVALVDNKIITGLESKDQINSTSIDLRLGEVIMVERGESYVRDKAVSLRDRDQLTMDKYYMGEHGYILRPGEFILASSVEMFNLPNWLSAEYKLKSSMARIGLEHLNAGWCDAGWNGSVLTLELKNMTRNHDIQIRPGDRIGQIVFFEHVPVPLNQSYQTRGRYNNDKQVTAVKP